MVGNPARGHLNRKHVVSLSPLAPENLVSRDRFGRPVPRKPAHSPCMAIAYRIPTAFFHNDDDKCIPSTAIGSVPSLSGHINA